VVRALVCLFGPLMLPIIFFITTSLIVRSYTNQSILLLSHSILHLRPVSLVPHRGLLRLPAAVLAAFWSGRSRKATLLSNKRPVAGKRNAAEETVLVSARSTFKPVDVGVNVPAQQRGGKLVDDCQSDKISIADQQAVCSDCIHSIRSFFPHPACLSCIQVYATNQSIPSYS
jgi:hypothetical protein